jgi:hypothetical protein
MLARDVVQAFLDPENVSTPHLDQDIRVTGLEFEFVDGVFDRDERNRQEVAKKTKIVASRAIPNRIEVRGNGPQRLVGLHQADVLVSG